MLRTFRERFLESEVAAELYVDEVLLGDGTVMEPSRVDGVVRIMRGGDALDAGRRDSCIREFTSLGERLLLKRWPYGS